MSLSPPHNTVVFNVFTIINTTPGVFEIIRSIQQNPTGLQAITALDHAWLTQYPKPVRIIFDQGKYFLNVEFGGHLVNLGIKPISCAVANPQSNEILERLHNTIKTAMRIEFHANPPTNIETAEAPIDSVL